MKFRRPSLVEAIGGGTTATVALALSSVVGISPLWAALALAAVIGIGLCQEPTN